MLRPWYKSLVFYLGLPVFLFLLWAWADSNFHHSSLRKSGTTPSRTLYYTTVIANSPGAVWVSHRTRKGNHGKITGPFVLGRAPLQGLRTWFPAPEYKHLPGATYNPRVTDKDQAHTLITLPHWLLILLYLALWSLAFLWRRRRNKRSSAPAQPHSGLEISA
jgi:hypothetical protein